MSNDLVVIERLLQAVEPQLHNALSGLMPTKRLIQTVLISCERTPKLMRCSPQTILNGAMTFAVLGLPVDGSTGQGFLLPFKDRAQAVIGYRGYNTLGARAGLTITGAAVRADDHLFDYQLGSQAFVNHKPRLGSQEKIIAFWAVACAKDRPPIVSILSMSEVMAIKERSPAVRGGADTPWNDPGIGFIAMGEKSAKRTLARSTPLITEPSQFMLAARMEEAVDEQGKPAWISPERGVIIDGAATDAAPTPTAAALIGSKLSPQSPGDAAMTPPRPVIGQDGAGAGDDIKENDSDRLDRLDNALSDAAKRGMEALQACWESLDKADRVILKPALERRHKRAARRVDDAGDVP